ILEALRQGGNRRGTKEEAVPPPRPFQPEAEPSHLAVEPEEIPFIEVGGRKTPMEASASVMACKPAPILKLLSPAEMRADEPAPPIAPHVGPSPSSAIFGLT